MRPLNGKAKAGFWAQTQGTGMVAGTGARSVGKTQKILERKSEYYPGRPTSTGHYHGPKIGLNSVGRHAMAVAGRPGAAMVGKILFLGCAYGVVV